MVFIFLVGSWGIYREYVLWEYVLREVPGFQTTKRHEMAQFGGKTLMTSMRRLFFLAQTTLSCSYPLENQTWQWEMVGNPLKNGGFDGRSSMEDFPARHV